MNKRNCVKSHSLLNTKYMSYYYILSSLRRAFVLFYIFINAKGVRGPFLLSGAERKTSNV